MTTKNIEDVVADKRYFEAPNVPIAKVFARTNDGTEYQLKEINLTQLVKEVVAGRGSG